MGPYWAAEPGTDACEPREIYEHVPDILRCEVLKKRLHLHTISLQEVR